MNIALYSLCLDLFGSAYRSFTPFANQLLETRLEPKTNLVSNGKNVDYVFVRPGERESLQLEIELDTPGKYVLTPIVNYDFRNNSSSGVVASYKVIYPRRFQTWIWEQGKNKNEWILMSNNL